MPTGLRAADAPLIQKLVGNDQRLLLRLGALLQAQLAVTEAVLSEIGQVQGLEALLRDRKLAKADADAAGALADHHCGDDHGLVLETHDDGWRVLCFDDELGNPLLTTSAPGQSEHPALQDLLPRLPESQAAPVRSLLAATSDEARAAAVEQLRYVQPDTELLAELMPLVLSDGAERVREVAVRLLAHAGLRPALGELVVAIHEHDERVLERLEADLAGASGDECGIALAAIIAALERGIGSPELLALVAAIPAQALADRRLPRLLELALEHGRSLSLMAVIRRLQAAGSDRVAGMLTPLLGRSRVGDARLIPLLVPPGGELVGGLAERALDLLMAAPGELGDRMPLAAACARSADPSAIAAGLAARADALATLKDGAAFWLLGELARAAAVDAATAAALLPPLLHQIGESSGPQVGTILEQRLPACLPLPASIRHRAVEPLGELAARSRDDRSLDLISAIMVELDPHDVEPLWRLLEEHPQRRARWVALVGLVPALRDADGASAAAAVDRLLKLLPDWSDAEERGRGLDAAARLAHLPGLAGDAGPAQRVDAAAERLGPHGWSALGRIAAGPHVAPTRRSELVDRFLRHTLAEISDDHTRSIADGSDDQAILFDATLSSHTRFVPVLLEALGRCADSPHLPAPLLRHLVDRLSSHYQAVTDWRVVWAPGNVQLLGAMLAELGARRPFPGHLRRRIAETLERRLRQPEIAARLARVLAADPDGDLAGVAARSLRQLIHHQAEGRFLDDEQSEVAAALVEYLAVPDLGDDDASLRRRLATSLSGLRSACDTRIRERLRELLVTAEPDLQERFSWLAADH